MSLLVVHDLERRPSRAAAGLYLQEPDALRIELESNIGDATSLTVLTWQPGRAPRAATLRYGELTYPASAESIVVSQPGDATSLMVVPWRTQRAPRAALLVQGLPDVGNAPPPPSLTGDATTMSVIVYRAWQQLRRWPGLAQNTAQDDDGPTFNYASMSDYFVQYDPILYSPMSRGLYQTAPAHDESAPVVGQFGDATSVLVLVWPGAPLRRHQALYSAPATDVPEPEEPEAGASTLLTTTRAPMPWS